MLVALIGNGLIVFGPVLSIFFGYIYLHPQLVVISIVSSFFHILSLLLTSVVWIILPVKQNELSIIVVSVGVFVFEIIRFLYYLFYIRADKGFQSANNHKLYDSSYEMIPIGISSGVGYAISRSLISYGSILAMNYGPGTAYLPNCPNINFFLASSLSMLFLEIIDIGLMTIAFQGYHKRSLWRIPLVFVIHICSSGITALNILTNSCYYTIPSLALIAFVVSFIWVFELYLLYRKK
jgi:anterior pharynx defective protein 1